MVMLRPPAPLDASTLTFSPRNGASSSWRSPAGAVVGAPSSPLRLLTPQRRLAPELMPLTPQRPPSQTLHHRPPTPKIPLTPAGIELAEKSRGGEDSAGQTRVPNEPTEESTCEESASVCKEDSASTPSSSEETQEKYNERYFKLELNIEEKKTLQKATIGLYCMYALVGLNYGFFSHYINIPICQYVFGPMNDEGRTTVQQCNVSASIITMPWNFKVFYGFLIDSFPLMGSPRRNWIIMGWSISMLLLLAMALFAENLAVQDHGFDKYCLLCMAQCVFYMFADVAGDGMTVELTKLEPEEIRGHILTTGQMVRFSTTIFINFIGIFAMNGPSYIPKHSHESGHETCGKKDVGLVFPFELGFGRIHLALFAIQVPFFVAMIYYIRDPPRKVEHEYESKRDALSVVWTCFKTKAMFYLILFSYGSIAIGGLGNPASGNIANIAQPTTLQMSVGNMFGSMLFLGGVAAFRKYFMNRNWRFTFVWTSILTIGQCIIQLLTIYDAWGIGQDGWFFVLGSNILSFIAGIAQVLGSLAVAEIAPAALEATIYETLTSIHNAAIALNTNLQNFFVPVFQLNGISSNTYFPCGDNTNPDQAGMNSHMATATYFTIVVNVLGTILFAYFFPKSKAETHEWMNAKAWQNTAVGALGVVLGFGGFIFAVVVSFLSLFPDTMCLRIAGGMGCGTD
eukprot:TRINITY_DN81964_c0_g1_i1.p1 TRINITY_DN81964_c0_g1~~TRINITY_DN81964_c0_g1_i1.p1  ORF type:complete len:683 (-),score=150.21 TRINITY_DN81964_c0_g1_i1:559-2607(-)